MAVQKLQKKLTFSICPLFLKNIFFYLEWDLIKEYYIKYAPDALPAIKDDMQDLVRAPFRLKTPGLQIKDRP